MSFGHPSSCSRQIFATLLCLSLVAAPALAMRPPRPATPAKTTQGDKADAAAPQLDLSETRELARVKFENEILWRKFNDIGLVHVYTKGELWTVDLTTGGLVGDSIKIPALERNALVPLPATNIVLSFGSPKDRKLRAFDVLQGQELWSAEQLPPPTDVIPFYDQFLVLLVAPSEKENHLLLTAINVRSGETVWSHDLPRRKIAVDDDYVRLLGCPTTVIDVATGRTLWEIQAGEEGKKSKKTTCTLLPDDKHVLLTARHRLELWEIPPVDELPEPGEAPVITKARRLWEQETRLRDPQFSSAGPGVMNVAGVRYQEIRRIDTGELLLRNKVKYWSSRVRISPDGKWGLAVKRRKLLVYDLAAENAPVPLVPKTAVPLFVLSHAPLTDEIDFKWQDNGEVLLVRRQAVQRNITGIARLQVPSGKEVFTIFPPPPPKYSLTAAEKRRAWGRGLLSFAALARGVYLAKKSMSAAYAPNASDRDRQRNLAIANMSAQLAALGAIGLVSTVSEVVALKRQHKLEALEGQKVAMKRYRQRLEMAREDMNTTYFITGKKGAYKIVAINLETGKQEVVGRYNAKKVHEMAFDAPYGLGTALENNNHHMSIFWAPSLMRIPRGSPILKMIKGLGELVK